MFKLEKLLVFKESSEIRQIVSKLEYQEKNISDRKIV